MTVPFNAHLRDLAPYPPGKPIEELQRELGLDRVIKLASNENPLGPSPRALKAVRAAERDLHLYPDGHAFVLRGAVAAHLGVDPERLIFGSGSDEVLMLLALTFLGPGTNLVMSQYGFIRPRMHATLVGAETKIVDVIPRHHEQDVEAMGFAIDDRTRMVYLANPNNPTGDLVCADRVQGLLRMVPENCLCVLDEAYHEYCAGAADYQDSIAWLERHPNLVVLRTFSKAYGLAGLRCGHGIAHPDVIQAMERVRPPFNVTRAAQAAAHAALEDQQHIAAAVEVNRTGLAQIQAGLASLPVDFTPSRGNFLLVDVHGLAQPLYEALLRRGVIVRPMGGYGLPQCLRISVGTREENEIMLEALGAVLTEHAESKR